MPPSFGPFAHLFKALAEANRLRILHAIGPGEKTVSELVAATGLSQPLVSHHLRALRAAGVLRSRRDGAFVLHALADTRVLAHLEAWGRVVRAVRQRALEVHGEFDLPHWRSRPTPAELRVRSSRDGKSSSA